MDEQMGNSKLLNRCPWMARCSDGKWRFCEKDADHEGTHKIGTLHLSTMALERRVMTASWQVPA